MISQSEVRIAHIDFALFMIQESRRSVTTAETRPLIQLLSLFFIPSPKKPRGILRRPESDILLSQNIFC